MKKLYYIIFTIFISLNSYAEDFRTLQQGFDNLKFGDIKESSRKDEVIKLNNILENRNNHKNGENFGKLKSYIMKYKRVTFSSRFLIRTL